MDRIDLLRTFVRVMETGSFTLVAEQLGIGQPAISKRIALLENEFRTQLFVRSTRALRPTPEAEGILKVAIDILAAFDNVIASEAPSPPLPTGTLRVAVPTSFGRNFFRTIFTEYRRRYPDVRLDIRCSEEFVDLVGTGTELAIRIGSLSSSALIARRVGLVRRQLVASPALFEVNRQPLLPEHLAALPCITYARLTPQNQWIFDSETGRHVVSINPNIICDEADVMTEATLEGLGVAVLPSWCARKHIDDGTLVEVLPDYAVPSLPMQILLPDSRWKSDRARLFRNLIIELSDDFVFDAPKMALAGQ